MRRVCVLVALAGCAARPSWRTEAPTAAPGDVVTTVRGAVERWRQAFQAASADGLALLYLHGPEVSVTRQGRAVHGWASVRAELDAFVRAYPKIHLDLTDLRVRALGESAAVADATLEKRYGNETRTVSETGALTLVFTRAGDAWVIVAEHFSFIPSVD